MDSFLFSKLFWGLVIILVGISFIAQGVFRINFPVGKVVIALILIYLGVRMLLGGFGMKQNTTVFSDTSITVDQLADSKYDVVFGSQKIDLSQAVRDGESHTVEVNVVFGEAKITIPTNMQVKVKSSSVFGSVRTPHNSTSFGQDEYATGGTPGAGALLLKVNAVFGSALVME
jgi:predicted membrane protein